MPTVTVIPKNLKREMFRLRGRFLKLQRGILSEGLQAAAAPVVQAAKATAPVRTGRLRNRIGTVEYRKGRRLNIAVGATRRSARDKTFPFWDRFQERGFRAMGRASRKTAKKWTVVKGKNFLKNAGVTTYNRQEQIFADIVFKRFAEVQAAGEAAGIV